MNSDLIQKIEAYLKGQISMKEADNLLREALQALKRGEEQKKVLISACKTASHALRDELDNKLHAIKRDLNR